AWRICFGNGWWSVFGKKRTRGGKKAGPPAREYLVLRQFRAEAPNRLWLWDITEHPTAEGKVYLCPIKDASSNRIVGYSISDRMTSQIAVDALFSAVQRDGRWPAVWCTSDRGCQFRSRKVARVLVAHDLVGSMGQVASAGDNAAMESFFSLLQRNVLNRRRWATRQDRRIAINTWIERTYHRRRRQHRLGRLTPIPVRDHHEHSGRTRRLRPTVNYPVQQTRPLRPRSQPHGELHLAIDFVIGPTEPRRRETCGGPRCCAGTGGRRVRRFAALERSCGDCHDVAASGAPWSACRDLEVAVVVDRAGVATTGEHHREAEAISGDLLGQVGARGVERVEAIRSGRCPERVRPGGVQHGAERGVRGAGGVVEVGHDGVVEQVARAVTGQRPGGRAGVLPEARRAPRAAVERAAAVADDELGVLGVAVVGGDDVPGQGARVVPPADVLERAVAALDHRYGDPVDRDVGVVRLVRRQDEQKVGAVDVGAVLDAAELGPQVVAAEPVGDEALAGVGH
ncbi:MAG: IS3 family transposase, partial [Dietzia sp.]|nr:IS3 family transposase [Dietzia sp.]